MLWCCLLIVKEEVIIKITLFTTNCPKCKILKQKLDQKNITYDMCEDVNIMQSKGIMSAPMLEIDGQMKNFNEAILLLKEI